MPFKDYFSNHAQDYATYRPDYPPELFKFLSEVVPEHNLAWDCATGNGQAAVELANYFKHVIATDASEQQIATAVAKDNITYRVMPAEKTDFADQSVDLITVAQALHWFDFDKFYNEANRILKPQGVLAAWSYGLSRIDPEVDKVIDILYNDITKPYWDHRRQLIDEKYQTIPFPLQKITAPAFVIEKNWDLLHFINYLNTWSGLKNYINKTNTNPLDDLLPKFMVAWGDPAQNKLVRWPVYLLAGKKAV